MLAYYPFDRDFKDASGNANDLFVVEGEPTIITTEGDFIFGGGALDTDSTVTDREFLELTNPLSFEAADAWTIAFWARRRAGSDDRQGMVIGDTANTLDFVWLSNNPLQVQGLRFRSSDNVNANYDVGMDHGEWHHWALVADGAGNLTVYLDNVSLGLTVTSTTFSVRNVAHAYNTFVHSMNGQIDELYVYDEALDAAAVEALFLGTGDVEFAITGIDYFAVDDQVTLTWNSLPGESYTIKYSLDLFDWSGELDNGVAADAEASQTTKTFDLEPAGLTGVERVFFRVEKQ